MKILLIFVVYIGPLIAAASGPPDTTDFFPNIKDNLTRVTWAHAVNNIKYLEEVLEGDLMMIEADIVLGKLIDDPTGTIQPVMAHPPAKTSDISLEQFLKRINDFNNNTQGIAKGVKLDFKSIEVFEASLEIIDVLYNEVRYPVWINADIIKGPVNSLGTPVDAERFLKGNSPYPAVMLSPGWTTRFDLLTRNGSYTDEQIQEMLAVIERNDVRQKLTFPIRAGIGANSPRQMEALLSASPPNSTLTIWSGQGDPVNIEKLRELILNTGLDKIYLDVPKEISDQLHL